MPHSGPQWLFFTFSYFPWFCVCLCICFTCKADGYSDSPNEVCFSFPWSLQCDLVTSPTKKQSLFPCLLNLGWTLCCFDQRNIKEMILFYFLDEVLKELLKLLLLLPGNHEKTRCKKAQIKDHKERESKLFQLPESLKDFTADCKDINKTMYDQKHSPWIMRNNYPLLLHARCSFRRNGHRTK